MDYTAESGRFTRKDVNAKNNDIDSFAPLITFTDSDRDSECVTDSESSIRDHRCGLDSSYSVSSSSSSIPSPVFSQVKHQILTSTSYSMPSGSPKQSPPVQKMERLADFDPNRIPPSVFAIPLSPMDWSDASNDSLFSIRIGNFHSSMARTSGDLYRSGELSKSGEILHCRGAEGSGEVLMRSAEGGVEPERNSDVAKGISEERTLGERGDVYESPNKVNEVIHKANRAVPRDSCSVNGRNDRSITHTPRLTSPRKKKSSCPFCCCTCPIRCCFKWPNCCCNCSSCSCKWFSFLSLRNCFTWPSCSCKWLSSCFKCCNCKSSCPKCRCKLPSCHCCKCSSCSSCCPKCPSWSNCCKCPSWSNCCKCPSWSSCCCKCLHSWRCGCECPPGSTTSCFKCPCCSSCSFKCPSCSSFCCNCPSLSSCCSKCSTCPSCNCSTCPSCSCLTCPSCSCLTCPSCKCHRPSCSWLFCCQWERKPKGGGPSNNVPDVEISFTTAPKPPPRKRTCFSCCSPCSSCHCLRC